jgi:hypothetical protein
MALRQPNISDLRAHLADSLARCAFGSASPKFFRASVAATPNRSFLTALRSGEVNRTLARVRGATTNLQCGTKGEPAGGFYKRTAEDHFDYSETFQTPCERWLSSSSSLPLAGRLQEQPTEDLSAAC